MVYKLLYIKFIVLFILLGLPKNHAAQNLVINPSFENLKVCPFGGPFGGFNWRIKNWWGLDSASAGLYNTCDITWPVPNTLQGY